MVEFTGRDISFCSAVIMAAYEQYYLWYVSLDFIAFARRFFMDMAVVLGSRVNVLEPLEMLEIIESISFNTFPNACREHTVLSINYHDGQTDPGGYFIY